MMTLSLTRVLFESSNNFYVSLHKMCVYSCMALLLLVRKTVVLQYTY